jgi:hypothetical protein
VQGSRVSNNIFTIRGFRRKNPAPAYCFKCNEIIKVGEQYYSDEGKPWCLGCFTLNKEFKFFDDKYYMPSTDVGRV